MSALSPKNLSPDKLGFSGNFEGDLSDMWNLRLDPTGGGSWASMEEDRDAAALRRAKQYAAIKAGVGANPDLDPAQIEERNRKIRESMRGQQGYASNILSMGSGPNTDYGMRNLSGLTEIAPQSLATSEAAGTSGPAGTGNTSEKRLGGSFRGRSIAEKRGRASDILGSPIRRGGIVRQRI